MGHPGYRVDAEGRLMIPYGTDYDDDGNPLGDGHRPGDGTDIAGQLRAVREAYRRWLGDGYDLGVLDAVLCTAAAERLGGDPPWLLVVGGPGAAKTETLLPLTGAGAAVVSTVSGEAALLSGTPEKEKAADATGGLLRQLGGRGLLVIKDVTSILSMNRDTRALVLAALREIHDGAWSREVGAEGGRTLSWRGRLVLLGAVTTAWDSAYRVVAAMGDRFVLVRLGSDAAYRRKAGMRAMLNTGSEAAMRDELSAVTATLLAGAQVPPPLPDGDLEALLDLADVVTRARTAVERDFQGNPAFAHALEVPTRFAKQLVQIVRGGLAIGMSRDAAMAVACRCAGDSMPPLRNRVLSYVAANQCSLTAKVVAALQLPRNTVDRTLQELHLLGLLVVDEQPYGQSVRWAYSLAGDVDPAAVAKLSSNVTTPLRER